MKPFYYFSILFLFCTSCASENQKKSLHRIGEVYETKASYSKGMTKKSGQLTVNYFKVTVLQNAFIDSLVPQNVSANTALMVYEDLSKKERNNLTHIEVAIKEAKSALPSSQRIYTLEELENPAKKSNLFQQFSEKLKVQDYDGMVAMMDSSIIRAEDVEFVSNYIDNYVLKNGKVKEFKRIGFGMRLRENNDKRYEFQGMLIFENGKKVKYVVQTYLEEDNETVFGFNIE